MPVGIELARTIRTLKPFREALIFVKKLIAFPAPSDTPASWRQTHLSREITNFNEDSLYKLDDA